MKKSIFKYSAIFLIAFTFTSCVTTTNENNKWTFDPEDGLYIQWDSESSLADEMTHHAMEHMYNVENEKSYTFFEKSLEYDSTLFGPHVVLAGFSLSGSEIQNMHIKQAKFNSSDKNETSKLFVSLLDLPQSNNWPLAGEGSHDIWKKMRTVEPKGKLIHYYYAFTFPEISDRIFEMEKLLAELENNEGSLESLSTSGNHKFMIAPVINSLGYFYYAIGEKAKAKDHFDRYLTLYPSGYNSYDSMGEYYFNEGDLDTALTYYNKAIELYPPAVSANSMIVEINELRK
jgi:tetratricopeptide (TPR) repeat protein|tara:strand:+ start:3053 stop:3913 length:861 start_codon:yes stop_codon:yes gene_type:complete